MLIMQRKHQFPIENNLKTTRPPPVPPRPDKNLVAEALAKTRKAEYQNAVFSNNPKSPNPQPEQTTNASPKLNGLSRVKSFIRDVISDKKSNDEKKQNGNANPPKTTKAAKDDAKSQLPVSSAFKLQSGKKGKNGLNSNNSKLEDTRKKSLVRSLSSSLKSEQKSLIYNNGDKDKDSNRVSKSNSFAEKAFPVRRAPPPPISPKPNRNNLEKLIIKHENYQPVLKLSASCEELNRPSDRPIIYHSKLPKITTYVKNVSVEDVDQNMSKTETDRIHTPDTSATVDSVDLDNNTAIASFDTSLSSDCKRVDSTFDESNIDDYVTRKLISEIIEANKPENVDKNSNSLSDVETREATKNKTTIMLNGDDSLPKKIKTDCDDEERLKRLNDISNHELLISELESMRREATEKKFNDQTAASDDKFPSSPDSQSSVSNGISRHSSVQSFSIGSLSNNDDCEMCLADEVPFYIAPDLACRLQEQFSSSQKMAALRGLPPLPKSLSGFSEVMQRISVSTIGSEEDASTPVSAEDVAVRLAVNGSAADTQKRIPTTLDSQLAVLRREMLSLRQLDLSLLSQLWALNEAIWQWRQELGLGGPPRAPPLPLRPAPPPPLSPSSSDEPSSRSLPSVEYVSS